MTFSVNTSFVPLVEENGEEVEQYSGMTTSGAAYSILIPVSSSIAGKLPCRAYLNGELIASQEVDMQ